MSDGLVLCNVVHEPKNGKILFSRSLRCGLLRTPKVSDKVKRGNVTIAGRSNIKKSYAIDQQSNRAATTPAQQPALFDFAKERRAVALAVE